MIIFAKDEEELAIVESYMKELRESEAIIIELNALKALVNDEECRDAKRLMVSLMYYSRVASKLIQENNTLRERIDDLCELEEKIA